MPYDQQEFRDYASENILEPSRPKYNLWAAVSAPVAVGAAGFIPWGKGRLWDKYVSGFRHVEGLSPGRILRTFRISETLSPLAAPMSFGYNPSEYSQLLSSPGFKDYMARISGLSITDLEGLGAFEKGIEWRKSGVSAGVLGELRVIGSDVPFAKDVGLISTADSKRVGRVAEYFARVMGVTNPRGFMTPQGVERAAEWLPIAHPGGKAQLTAQYAHALGSAGIGRLNLLLQSPFQYDAVQRLVKRVPLLKKISPAVKDGTALQMLGRYTTKAAGAYLLYHGLKYLDYMQREEGGIVSLPRNLIVGGGIGLALTKSPKGAGIGAFAMAALGTLPIFQEGFLPGLAEIYSRLRQDFATATWPWRGGSKQAEENYPGITKITTMLGMAGSGLLLGGAKTYYERLKLLASLRGKMPLKGELEGKGVYEAAETIIRDRRENIAKTFSKLAEGRTGIEKLIAQATGKWRSSAPYLKGAITGIASFVGLATVGSFLSGDYLGAATRAFGGAVAGVAWAKSLGRTGVKGRFGMLATAAGALVAPFLLRGQRSPDELERIYSGEELVPIKRGRWWEFGRSSFEGKRPYFRPHRLAMMRLHSRENALYGSEEAYWDTDPIRHPIRFLLDPYKRERIMWEQGWRFPVSQVPFEDFPILGPVLAATVGKVIKPARLIAPDQWQPPADIGPAPEGYDNLPPPTPITKTGIMGTVGEQVYRLTEAVGLPGFVAESLKERFTGAESWFPRDQLMSPGVVSGIEPGYWSLSLGGLGGFSELIRRFIPHRRYDVDLVNPQPTGLPSWLPGPESDYFLDFTRGDVYTKLKEPWARLPGKGYASVHPEVSGVDPENYPAYWRFRVLADVAPWSREYTQYSRIVTSMADRGELTPDEIIGVQETKEQVKKVKKNLNFTPYRYDTSQVKRERVTIQSEVEPGVYLTEEFGKAPIVLAGTQMTQAALARVAMREDANITKAEALRRGNRKRLQVSDFLREYLYPGAELDVYVNRDPSLLMEKTAAGPVVPAVALAGSRNLNQEIVRQGLADKEESDTVLGNLAAVSHAQRAFGSLWEGLMHGSETPLEVFTPIAPISKFIHQRTALEEYQRSRIYARDVALWEKPIDHFLAPGLRTTAWWMGWRGVPREVRERYMIQEYFDRLEYMKYRRLQKSEVAKGHGDAAAQYAGKAARTMTGVNRFSPMQASLAVPKQERDYFRAFVEAPTIEERQEIARLVSPQMKRLLEGQWMRREAEGARMRLEAGIGGEEERAMLRKYNEVYQQEKMSSQPDLPEEMTPPPTWVGWDPAYDLRDSQLKTVMDSGMDYHDFGFWPSDIKGAQRRPYVESIGDTFADSVNPETDRISSLMGLYRRMIGMQGYRGYADYTRRQLGGVGINVASPGLDRIQRYMHDDTISRF